MKKVKFFSGIFIAATACASLTGCEVQAPPEKKIMMLERSERFQVDRVAIFEDRLAYEDKRGIYIIRDVQTGKEYVGVSGVGISEIGSHLRSSGKHSHTVQDER